ncbi:MAG: hypothetical protein CBR30_09170 [Dictyoglomus sp. NZ13-RE01]|nr:MAG: hypothetical protein CBR30_09170 [Dictyoglomus sp. NZ13-RE01]
MKSYKVSREILRKDLIIILLILLMFIIGFVSYPFLPEKIPMHWNFKGEIDRYGSKFEGVWAIPLLTLFLYLGLLFIPYIDPERENYIKFEKVYQIIKLSLVIVLSILYYITIIVGLGGPKDLIPKIVPITIGILFIILGNYMPRIKHNWFVGIRTPWTLSNEEVWRKTHRFGGYLFVISGILMIITGFLPPYWNFVFLILSVFLSGVLSIFYSFILYKRIENKKGEF